MGRAAHKGETVVEIYTRSDGQVGFRARAANNRIIGSSEGYTRKQDAKRGARRAHPGLLLVERAGKGQQWRTID